MNVKIAENTKKHENITLEIAEAINYDVYRLIIMEIIKYLVYFTYQIPLPFDRLKFSLDKIDDSGHEVKLGSASADAYLRVTKKKISEADELLQSLSQQFCSGNPPIEVCLAIGSTPFSSKEVYHIHTPHLHVSESFISDSKKIVHNVLRNLIKDTTLAKMKHRILKPSVVYVLIRKTKIDNPETVALFTPVNSLYLPPSATQTSITLRPSYSVDIFEDSVESSRRSMVENFTSLSLETANEESCLWMQCTKVLRGFRDRIVKGQSVLQRLGQEQTTS